MFRLPTQNHVVDEKSMISLRQLYWIDQRCRQIFPESRNVPFGGLNIILAGDFYQLPPVFNKPLYYTGSTGSQPSWLLSRPIVRGDIPSMIHQRATVRDSLRSRAL
ncbi:uncharacterized protein N7487_003791 [Penicillium crustosum]|uniref:uncharacterized protein n=1 Tax=Penicillium crustosum TaxID=36656 RepID=UPI00239DEDA0|nr:uncharacterized protein N7487_003791 [Penicillium crustosum]KAJ5409432.1 hypothetical protein N7487_003791 [Penicillium crustosum]